MTQTNTDLPPLSRLSGVANVAGRAAGRRFVTLAVLLVFPVGLIAFVLAPDSSSSGTVAAVGVFLLGAALAASGFRARYPHDRLGLGNIVTLVRLALIASITGLLLVPAGTGLDAAQSWSLIALATLTLGLDGIDGFFARRQGLTSEIGARFDMEVDAAFAALLALILLLSGKVGAGVLILGLMRYGFALSRVALPWLRGRLPESRRRKVVCAIQIGTLIFLLVPQIGPELARPIATLAGLVLAWSFLTDTLWLWRNR